MKKLFIFIIIFGMFFISRDVSASSVYMQSTENVNRGETFKVLISADTEEAPINSVDFVVSYREDLVSFVGYKSNDTLVKMWINAPSAKEGKIYMNGIIPGGVNGVYDTNKEGLLDIPVVQLIFQANKEGTAYFSFDKSVLLKHDGMGNTLEHTQSNLNVLIKESAPKDKVIVPNEFLLTKDEAQDTTPPLPFVISLIKSSLFSRTPQMIYFNTEDADSGIEKYQISINGGNWKDVSSPDPVAKGLFTKDITIRAYDFNGNFQDSEISINGYFSLRTLILLLILILSGILGYKLLK